MKHKRTDTADPLRTRHAAVYAATQRTPGMLPFRMTNDYLFRAVFQSNPKALEGLCRAVLRLAPTDTLAVTVLNPIELGAALDDKEFILDLNVLINGSSLLNLEMQVKLPQTAIARMQGRQACLHSCNHILSSRTIPKLPLPQF